MIRRISILTLSILISHTIPIYSQEPDSLIIEKLFNMSLEELLNVKVNTGSLLSSTYKNSISPITIITKEQIQISQARNVATLMEIYVPGMVLMAHQEGDKIGIRGLIAAENYKLLLLINGKNVTNAVYEGALLELDQWDMNDIEKIEVMRGPGSVTYGSGAIAGVINIITKDSETVKTKISALSAYDPVFRSVGGNVQFSDKFGKLGVYLFTSLRRSLGQDNPDYFVPSPNNSTDVRYVGKMTPGKTGPQPFLADALDRPQIKAHLNVKYGDHFNIWTRYTQSGQTHVFTTTKRYPDTNGDTVLIENPTGLTMRSFALVPEYQFSFSDNLRIISNISFDTQEYLRYRINSAIYPTEHYNNISDYAFSQGQIVGKFLLNYESHKIKATGGYQYNRTAVKAPWGKSPDYLLIYEGVNIINSTISSTYYTDQNSQIKRNRPMEQVGKGIFTSLHSLLLEVSYDYSKYLKLMHSARLDFSNISSPMYSPRISLSSEINEKNIIILTAQRSLRMMPLRAQYLYHKYSQLDTTANKSEHESLNSIELGYLFTPTKNALLNIHTFYNEIYAVGYTGNDLQFLGELQLWGIDFEASFNWENSTLIVNHSCLNLINMDMNEDLKTGTNRNNISFSDYYYYTDGAIPILLTSYGNGLNNISKNSTKLIFTYKCLHNKLILHANSRIFWDYDGSHDELHMYSEAYNKFDISILTPAELILFNKQKADFEREKKLLEENGAYKPDFKFNMSVSYNWEINERTNIFATIYSDNLIGSRKRYYVSTGSAKYYPERLRFIEEPRTIGFKFQVNFK